MKKKKIIYSIIAILVLVICYIVGQTVVKPNRTDSLDNEEKPYYYNYVLKSDELMYEGFLETTDMPGGKTVGLVEDDVYGKWYLLSPNTSITAGIILDDAEYVFSFEYCIHKNVSHLSDGMQLSVKIIQEDTEEILYEDDLTVDGTKKEYSVNMADWKNSNVFIFLQASNESDDESGDWLVIKNAIID